MRNLQRNDLASRPSCKPASRRRQLARRRANVRVRVDPRRRLSGARPALAVMGWLRASAGLHRGFVGAQRLSGAGKSLFQGGEGHVGPTAAKLMRIGLNAPAHIAAAAALRRPSTTLKAQLASVRRPRMATSCAHVRQRTSAESIDPVSSHRKRSR